MIRVVIFVSSVNNPFVGAWLSLIRMLSPSTIILLDPRLPIDAGVPPHLKPMVITTAEPSWIEQVEAALGGTPDRVFYWWGTSILKNATIRRVWPEAHAVLCLDTFPNASRMRAEIRDYVQAAIFSGRLTGVVFTSRRMREVYNAYVGRQGRRLSAVVYSPFPLKSHVHDLSGITRANERTSLCFTGRSDHLYSGEPGMRKDALGAHLEAYIAHGVDVYVGRPRDESAASFLLERGLRFYNEVSSDSFLDGGFGSLLSQFDGHIVQYASVNSTIRRRMATGLSTRFATAVLAPTPIIVPTAARFAEEVFAISRIGFTADKPLDAVNELRRSGESMRANWLSDHKMFAGEAFIDDVRRVLEG